MTPGVPPRLPLLSQRLVVVTGKGGVGKTTVTAALAQAAAASGRRVLAVEVGRGSLGSLLGGLRLGAEPTRVRAGLAAASLEPEALLGDFVAGVLRFRVLARRLLESTSFQVLAAAAPGLGEFLVLHRLLGWVEARRGRRPVHDLVIVDAPASGHSLPLLAAPHTLGALARLGPVAELLARLQRLIADPGATLVCVVTTPEELAVRETVELHRELRERPALAVEAARRGRRTAVLTVDPSHRLKDALGLSALAGRPSRVSLAGIGARGAHLDALLLDVKRTFDELVRALATTPEQARAVLENRLYQNLSGTLAGTAEYMAVEQVYRLAAEGGYDLLVVDTPPARHAVDFLDAPRRLANLLDSRAFAILKDPTSILPAPDPGLPDGVPAALATRLAASYAELRALGARQEATLAPLVDSARAPVLAEVPLLATDPGSLADLAAIARHLFPDPGRAAAVGVRG